MKKVAFPSLFIPQTIQKSLIRKQSTNLRLYLGGAPKSLQMVTAAMNLKDAYSLEEKL